MVMANPEPEPTVFLATDATAVCVCLRLIAAPFSTQSRCCSRLRTARPIVYCFLWALLSDLKYMMMMITRLNRSVPTYITDNIAQSHILNLLRSTGFMPRVNVSFRIFLQGVSKKCPPKKKKLFVIFSLRLSLGEIFKFVGNSYPHIYIYIYIYISIFVDLS